MPHPLDFDNVRIPAKFLYDAIIAGADSICALGTCQLLRSMRQRLFGELRYFRYNTRYLLTWNMAQIFCRRRSPLKVKGGHRA